jgi:hypothetical protein
MSYSDFHRKMNDRRKILVEIEAFRSIIQPYCSDASRKLKAQFCESGLCVRRRSGERGCIGVEGKDKKCRKKEEYKEIGRKEE